MQIVVDQLLTNYTLIGNGKLVVWLHGWGDTAHGAQAMQAVLAKQYQVLAVDLPGFGSTEAPHESWDLTNYAHFVQSLLAKLHLKPYGFIGHSNGGAIAIRGLGSGSLQADKLVLLASAGIRTQPGGHSHAVRIAAKTAKVLVKPLPQRAQKRLRSKAYATIGSDALVAEHLLETFKKVVSDDVQTDAQNITIPSLLIYGSDDRATPTSYGDLLHAAIINSRFEVIPNAGHFVYLDTPDSVATLIEDFLK